MIFLIPNSANALIKEGVIGVVGWIAYGFAYVLGLLLTFLINTLVNVASFNKFIDVDTVKEGWKIVRDLCNMFFILILLVIAFATILRIESYNMKRWLPKLLIMAVLINFSRMICGLIIDFAQVIMLTFINGLGGLAQNNLINLFQVKEYLKFETSATEDVKTLTAVGTILAGLIALVITTVIVAVLLGILLIRIILLWTYTILSPLAFLLSAFPAGQRYASQWWSEFSKQVIVGPVLAFFLWLALATIPNTVSEIQSDLNISSQGTVQGSSYSLTSSSDTCAGIGALYCDSKFTLYIITIALLMGGLIVTQQVGGMAASVAGRGMSWAKKGAFFGSGAFLGYKGSKWVGDRWGAFQGRRESERKARVEATGDRMYGLYSGAKGAVAGTFKGLRNATTRRETGGLTTPLTELGAVKRWKDKHREARAAKKDENERLYNAYVKGEYVDKDQKTYKKGDEGFKQMSAIKAKFIEGWRNGTTKAKGIQNQANDEKIDKAHKQMIASGTGEADLMNTLRNVNESKEKRQAAALVLAIKEGFRSAKDVELAKKAIGSNSPLLKKFNDTIDKRFAHLNYDLSAKVVNGEVEYNNQGDAAKFKERLDEGVIKGSDMHSSAYENEGVIRALKDYSGLGFASLIDTAASRNSAARKSTKEGLKAARDTDLSSGKKLYDEESGEINAHAKTIARVHGDIVGAFNNTTEKGKINFDDKSQQAATEYFKVAKPAWLDNFNTDNLKAEKVESDFKVDNKKAQESVKTVEQAIADGINGSTLAGMQRSGQSPEFIRRSIGIIKDRNDDKYQKEITKNNILINIKEVEPDSNKFMAKSKPPKPSLSDEVTTA